MRPDLIDYRLPDMSYDPDYNNNCIPDYCERRVFAARERGAHHGSRTKAYVYPRTVWRMMPMYVYIITEADAKAVRVRLRPKGTARWELLPRVGKACDNSGTLGLEWRANVPSAGRWEVSITTPSDSLVAEIMVK
jgi:hypothetical protein